MRNFVPTAGLLATHHMFIRGCWPSAESRKRLHLCFVVALAEKLQLMSGPWIVAFCLHLLHVHKAMEARFIESAISLLSSIGRL